MFEGYISIQPGLKTYDSYNVNKNYLNFYNKDYVMKL